MLNTKYYIAKVHYLI